MVKHICIYCLEEKEEDEFNREHVIPRLMGRYENGLVLNSYQVCKDCNSYFSENIEDKMSLDSYEALLRMQYSKKVMSDGRRLGNSRITLTGDESIFKGIPFQIITDKSNHEKIRFEIPPLVGIIKNIEKKEYIYFPIDELPNITDEQKVLMEEGKGKVAQILNTGYPAHVLEFVLQEKGFLQSSFAYEEKRADELFGLEEFTTKVNFSIDSILRRVCAKTAFNYLCEKEGAEYVLVSNFDKIRKYIRYGQWSDDLWFRYSKTPVSVVTLSEDNAHVVGYMWDANIGDEYWSLCGCVTWFGEMTYVFSLGTTDYKIEKMNDIPCTNMAYCDNEKRIINEENTYFCYGGRPGDNKYQIGSAKNLLI